jgi:hypothetical protein
MSSRFGNINLSKSNENNPSQYRLWNEPRLRGCPVRLEPELDRSGGCQWLEDSPSKFKTFVTPLVEWPGPTGLPDDWFGTYLTLLEDLVIDGQTVITKEEVNDYYVPPQYYDPPLPDGVGAIQGYFVLCEPLAVGVHELSWAGKVRPPDNRIPVNADIYFALTIRVVP